MDASTSGPTGSISKREPTHKPARDRDAGPRRFRVMQALIMQGVIAIVLLGLVWFQRANQASVLLYLATLVIPIGWGYTFWSAWQRDEAARRDGRATKEFLAAEAKRTKSWLGAIMLAWIVLAAIVLLVF